MAPLVRPTSPPTAECSSALGNANKTNEHHIDNNHREDGYGFVTTVLHPPVKGVCPLPLPLPFPLIRVWFLCCVLRFMVVPLNFIILWAN